jgi:hypothetical protein
VLAAAPHELLERHGDLALRARSRVVSTGRFGAESVADCLVNTNGAFIGPAQQGLIL